MVTTRIIRRRLDYRAHKALEGGWQTITLCGKRGNWLNGMPGEPQVEEGEVDCSECLELMKEQD
jgi:hypothetical protein